MTPDRRRAARPATPVELSVAGMSGARRTGLAMVLVFAVAAMLLAGVGAACAMLGLQAPRGVGEAVSAAVDLLGWGRWIVVLALVYAVVKARENPV